MPTKKKNKNVVTSLGICLECGKIIKEGQKTKTRNGRKYHAKCAP
jgi:hypothetical protein